MESRVESHVLRHVGMNAKPPMFQAGLSTKFTKRHVANFHDTTLTAASAAKARAELKMERQANAIEKQQQKIEYEMKKIEAITEKLQRQQAREARRLRNRLTFAATRIQRAFRSHRTYHRNKRQAAAVEIQRHWRGCCGRQRADALAAEQEHLLADYAARIITRNVRILACRLALRHEIQWRVYAATVIQSIVRRHQATVRLESRRKGRTFKVRRNQAAVLIQSHIRGFLTRLIYMDVLFLVCRIQSVVRGFLVRKRISWLLSLNVHAIVELQAIIRGFLVRRQIKTIRQSIAANTDSSTSPSILRHESQGRSRVGLGSKQRLVLPDSSRSTQQFNLIQHNSPSRQATYALATMASITSPVTSPPRIKRSYWLPSGASANVHPARSRLPQLPVKRPLVKISSSPTRTQSFDGVALHAVTIQRMVRGKIAKPRPPLRLEPLIRQSQTAGHVVEESISIDKHIEEGRREREEILKHKLIARKMSEKKRFEVELARRQQNEMEENERKLMEREEKRTRLSMKTTQRKHYELKLRRLTFEQQREEKERMEMIREERLVRLHLKWRNRLAQDAVTQRRGSRRDPALEENESDPESDVAPPIVHDRREEDERIGNSHRRQIHTQTVKKVARPALPALAVPKPSKQRAKHSNVALKKTQELRAVYGASGLTNQTSTSSVARDLQAQYASWNFHTDDLAKEAELVEDDAEFDYGNEFEEVVEETKLARLIC